MNLDTVPAMPALTEHQAATLKAICERLVPSDSYGPGAVEAGAPTYIERALESAYQQLTPLYDEGLRTLDARAHTRHGKAFARLADAVQDDLLCELEAQAPETADRRFFETVRDHTIEGMFGHPRWGGNRNHLGWKLIGYKEPRLTWSESDQEIVDLPNERYLVADGRDSR